MSDNPFTASPQFPEIDKATWRQAAEASLKGARFEDRLVARTYDGLTIAPLYTQEDAEEALTASGAPGASPFVRGTSPSPREWKIAQRIDLAEPKAANAQALEDLEGGASALVIVCGPQGVRLESQADVATLLAGIKPELIWLTLEAEDERAAGFFLDYFKSQGLALSELEFLPAFAPLAAMARLGKDLDEKALAAQLAHQHEAYRAKGHESGILLLDGRAVAEALGSEAQEIAFVLAQGLAYLRLFESAGITPDIALKRLVAKITVDQDQFLSIAKLRALRLVFARFTQALGLAPQPVDIRAETSWRMLTARDPWVNLLRTTTACFAAATGGASEIALHPFTSALGRPDARARRFARNAQAILMEESGLSRVIDPAGGSYYVERLTQDLAREAWTIFQDIEKSGGIIAALRGGIFQALVGKVREKRQSALSQRRDKITGVSEFPDIHEAPVAVAAPLPPPPAAQGDFTALPRLRAADPFEALRQKAEGAGERPKLFLANLGTPADTIARATFAKNFLEVGGIQALSNDGFAQIADLVAAFKASGATRACLCSSDAVYAEKAGEAAAALKAAGATLLLLAGNPREDKERLHSAGVDLFIHAGMDIVAALTDIHRRIGL